jgi:hypothetical protein
MEAYFGGVRSSEVRGVSATSCGMKPVVEDKAKVALGIISHILPFLLNKSSRQTLRTPIHATRVLRHNTTTRRSKYTQNTSKWRILSCLHLQFASINLVMSGRTLNALESRGMLAYQV